jgi:hypothetical protein
MYSGTEQPLSVPNDVVARLLMIATAALIGLIFGLLMWGVKKAKSNATREPAVASTTADATTEVARHAIVFGLWVAALYAALRLLKWTSLWCND